MKELNKTFTEDLTSKTTFFYPCSGMDIQSITNLLDYYGDSIDNFILVDLNMDYDYETNDLNMQGFYGLKREDWNFDNKLGFKKIKIIKKVQYNLEQIENLVEDQLDEYLQNDRFYNLIGRVIDPKVIRYELEYNGLKFVLYLIHYEATIISEKIRLIKNNIDFFVFGLILEGHVNGAFSDQSFFMNKMLEFNPDILVSQHSKKYFTDYITHNEERFIFYKEQFVNSKRLKDWKAFNMMKKMKKFGI
jgi:hypothetical protein